MEHIERAAAELDERDSVRESLIQLSREVIRCSGRAVTMANAGSISRAEEELRRCYRSVEGILGVPERARDLSRTGLPLQALVEYCEASYFLALLGSSSSWCGEEIPAEARLLAIGDLVGEVRRHVVGLVASWRLEEAGDLVRGVSEIYSRLRYLDYPDSVAPGLRHKIDLVRRSLEDLETLLAEARAKRDLMESIRGLRASLGSRGCGEGPG